MQEGTQPLPSLQSQSPSTPRATASRLGGVSVPPAFDPHEYRTVRCIRQSFRHVSRSLEAACLRHTPASPPAMPATASSDAASGSGSGNANRDLSCKRIMADFHRVRGCALRVLMTALAIDRFAVDTAGRRCLLLYGTEQEEAAQAERSVAAYPSLLSLLHTEMEKNGIEEWDRWERRDSNTRRLLGKLAAFLPSAATAVTPADASSSSSLLALLTPTLLEAADGLEADVADALALREDDDESDDADYRPPAHSGSSSQQHRRRKHGSTAQSSADRHETGAKERKREKARRPSSSSSSSRPSSTARNLEKQDFAYREAKRLRKLERQRRRLERATTDGANEPQPSQTENGKEEKAGAAATVDGSQAADNEQREQPERVTSSVRMEADAALQAEEEKEAVADWQLVYSVASRAAALSEPLLNGFHDPPSRSSSSTAAASSVAPEPKFQRERQPGSAAPDSVFHSLVAADGTEELNGHSHAPEGASAARSSIAPSPPLSPPAAPSASTAQPLQPSVPAVSAANGQDERPATSSSAELSMSSPRAHVNGRISSEHARPVRKRKQATRYQHTDSDYAQPRLQLLSPAAVAAAQQRRNSDFRPQTPVSQRSNGSDGAQRAALEEEKEEAEAYEVERYCCFRYRTFPPGHPRAPSHYRSILVKWRGYAEHSWIMEDDIVSAEPQVMQQLSSWEQWRDSNPLADVADEEPWPDYAAEADNKRKKPVKHFGTRKRKPRSGTQP